MNKKTVEKAKYVDNHIFIERFDGGNNQYVSTEISLLRVFLKIISEDSVKI